MVYTCDQSEDFISSDTASPNDHHQYSLILTDARRHATGQYSFANRPLYTFFTL